METISEASGLEEAARLVGATQCPFAPAAIAGVTDESLKDIEVDLRVEHDVVFQLRWQGPWHGDRGGWEVERHNAQDESDAIDVVIKEIGRRWVELGIKRARDQVSCGFAGNGIARLKFREVVSNESCPPCSGSGSTLETRWVTNHRGEQESETYYETCNDCGGTGHLYYVGTIGLESNTKPTVSLVLDEDDRFATLVPDTTNAWWANLGAQEQWDVQEMAGGVLAFQARCELTFDSAVVQFRDSQAQGLVGVFNEDRRASDDEFKKVMAQSDEREARRALPSFASFLSLWSQRERCARFCGQLEKALWFRRTVLFGKPGALNEVVDSTWWTKAIRQRLIAQMTMWYLAAGALIAPLLFAFLYVHRGFSVSETYIADLYADGVADFNWSLAAACVIVVIHALYASNFKRSVRQWRRPSFIAGPIALVAPCVIAFALWMQLSGMPLTEIADHREKVIAGCAVPDFSDLCMAYTRDRR